MNFEIKKFEESDSEFINELNSDPEVSQFVQIYSNIYIILKESQKIGAFSINFFKYDGAFFSIALIKDIRNKKLGHLIINEITNYIFDAFPDIKKVFFHTNPKNERAKKSGINAGFEMDLNATEEFMNEGMEDPYVYYKERGI